MGRWLKELMVNGVVVGQYLGSDDPEEDVTAATRAAPRKGMEPPPLSRDDARARRLVRLPGQRHVP